MGTALYTGPMVYRFLVCLLVALPAWGQFDPAALQGQKFILRHIGEQEHSKIQKGRVSIASGDCDVAVEVNSASWDGGTLRFRLDEIGTVSVTGVPRGQCHRVFPEISLDLTGFSDAEKSGPMSAVSQLLMTPEHYLNALGIPFNLAPTPEGADIKPERPPFASAPKPLLRVDASFSEEARRAKFQGETFIKMIIGADGRPHRAEIVRPVGMGLDEAALRVIPLWRFEPARKDSGPVAMQATLSMSFRLL